MLPPPVLGASPSLGKAAALPLPRSSPFRGDVNLGERKPIPQGTTQQFTATGAYSDGSTQNLSSDVTWISSNPGVLSIDTNGLGAADGQTGGVTITVQSSSGATYTSINFAVTGAVLASITVHLQSATIAVGATQQSGATWTSSAPGVASVSSSGLTTGKTAGSASIQTAFRGLVDQLDGVPRIDLAVGLVLSSSRRKRQCGGDLRNNLWADRIHSGRHLADRSGSRSS